MCRFPVGCGESCLDWWSSWYRGTTCSIRRGLDHVLGRVFVQFWLFRGCSSEGGAWRWLRMRLDIGSRNFRRCSRRLSSSWCAWSILSSSVFNAPVRLLRRSCSNTCSSAGEYFEFSVTAACAVARLCSYAEKRKTDDGALRLVVSRSSIDATVPATGESFSVLSGVPAIGVEGGVTRVPLSGGLDPIPSSSIFLSSPQQLRNPSASI